MVLLYPEYNAGTDTGIQLTQFALSYSVGAWGAHFITLCIFLFAFSSLMEITTMVNKLGILTKSKSSMFIFRVLTVVFVFLGSIASLGLVWDMADVFMGIMGF